MKEKILVILMVIGIGIFAALSVYFQAIKDVTKPHIELPEAEITYEEGAPYAPLLEGVSAWDNIDDNITDLVRIDSIIPSNDYKTAVVTYAVYDSSYNICKVTKTVKYIPASKEEEEADE